MRCFRDQALIGEDRADEPGRIWIRKLEDQFAPSRSVVERTVGKCKTFRRLSIATLLCRMERKSVNFIVYLVADHVNQIINKRYDEYLADQEQSK
jgi:hypothetical protein